MIKNYYKLKYSKMFRDDEGGYNCLIDFTPVKKLGKRNKAAAVDLQQAVVYSYSVAFGETAQRPRYLASNKETSEEVKEEFRSEWDHIFKVIIEFLENNEKKLDI